MTALAFLAWGCLEDNEVHIPVADPEDGKPKEYIISDYKYYNTEVTELSSLCFNNAKDGFYAVSDGGLVFEIGLDGSTRKVLFNDGAYDWEGIDTDGSTIYLMEETKSRLYTLKDGELKEFATVVIPDGGAAGKGPEGIMLAGDIMYVGNQDLPKRVVKFSLKEKKSLGHFDLACVSKFISDLHYDKTDNTMWIMDSKGFQFYHCTIEGELLATYKIPFVQQGEALVIDHERKCAWVGCDISAKLYQIPIEF